MRYAMIALLTLMFVACADNTEDDGASAMAEDAVPAAEIPDDLASLQSPYATTPLRHEVADVHRVDLPSGEALSAHRGGARVIYALSPFSVEFQSDGENEMMEFPAGDVHRHGAGIHSITNVGGNEASMVIFERRDAPLPASDAEAETPVTSPGEGADEEVVFEDDLAQVHRVTLEPGARLPGHRGHPRVIYSMSEYTLDFTSTSGVREQSFSQGDAHYHDPGEHTVVNAGDTVAEFLVVEFMR